MVGRREFGTLAIGRRTFVGLRVEDEAGIRYLDHDQAKERYAREHFGGPPASDQARQQLKADFFTWWPKHSTQVRTWYAEWLCARGTEPVDLDANVTAGHWGYPVMEAMQLLERYAGQGWHLVGVSEDHGLYTGVDAPQETFLTRVRYLLAR
jgi:hypothetical protein